MRSAILHPLGLSVVTTGVIAAIIGFGTLYPMPASPMLGGNDKLQHFAAFAALAFPISLARTKTAPYMVAAALLYGGIIEVVQPFVGRNRSLADLWADVTGAALGAGAAVLLNWLLGGVLRRT